MKQLRRSIAVFSVVLMFTVVCFGQAAQSKKTYTFHGKVEAVDNNTKSLKVNGEEVKGWMAAMTMDYKVDDPAVLKKVKPGDQIMATVLRRRPDTAQSTGHAESRDQFETQKVSASANSMSEHCGNAPRRP